MIRHLRFPVGALNSMPSALSANPDIAVVQFADDVHRIVENATFMNADNKALVINAVMPVFDASIAGT
jgi:hypothetical protein